MIHSQRIVVLYDSITNSVFVSQVLTPLQTWLAADKNRTAFLISFEKIDVTHHPARAYIAAEKRITLIIYKRLPFFGLCTLWYATQCVKKIIKKSNNALIIARGPLAGYICLRARMHTQPLMPLTIQIRGLLTEEYEYTYRQQHLSHEQGRKQYWLYRIKLWLYKQLERTVYSNAHEAALIFEAVSPALQEHLIKTYDISEKNVSIAYDDIPPLIAMQKRKQWRAKVRTCLNIPDTAKVYCYAGSAKSWQCPTIFFTFCQHKIAPDPQAYLLVLSQDYAAFQKLLAHTQIPPERCLLISAEHADIYQYLAAADTGLAFRDATLLNWVSRPTKLLEYQAAGLQIMHNATIAWVTESARNPLLYTPPLEHQAAMNVLTDQHMHAQNP